MPRYYLFLLFLCFSLQPLAAQVTPQGFPYQAMALNESGEPQANRTILVHFALWTQEGEKRLEHFQEVQELTTDADGYFSAIIGQGYERNGHLAEVPWASGRVWLDVQMVQNPHQPFRQLSSTRLFSVPYALFAEQAGRLTEIPLDTSLRSTPGPSIYWSTSGNYMTSPPVHYLGTSDNKDLVFKTNGEVRSIISRDGKFTMKSGVSGGDGEKSSYPLYVHNSNQGIFIEIDGSRDGGNNFVTFADREGIQGRIQGETESEWRNSTDHEVQNALFGLQIVSLTAQAVNLGLTAAGAFASGMGAGAGAGLVIEAVSFGVNLANTITGRSNYMDYHLSNLGVTYKSGGADYGEWLPRMEEMPLRTGQVVGVYPDGVSLNTNGARLFRVVTNQSAVLGNAPLPGEKDQYEKIAFLGQVPVWVTGPVESGDFIIPSGRNDGVGQAVHPDSMNWGDFRQIVGVAWQDVPDEPLHLVNVAVGLTTDEFSDRVAQLNSKLDQIIAYLQQDDPNASFTYRSDAWRQNQPTTAGALAGWSEKRRFEAFEELLRQQEPYLKMVAEQVQNQLTARDVDPANLPIDQAFFADPVQYLIKKRKDPEWRAAWRTLDREVEPLVTSASTNTENQ